MYTISVINPSIIYNLSKTYFQKGRGHKFVSLIFWRIHRTTSAESKKGIQVCLSNTIRQTVAVLGQSRSRCIRSWLCSRQKGHQGDGIIPHFARNFAVRSALRSANQRHKDARVGPLNFHSFDHAKWVFRRHWMIDRRSDATEKQPELWSNHNGLSVLESIGSHLVSWSLCRTWFGSRHDNYART